jgi:hypothetical protein
MAGTLFYGSALLLNGNAVGEAPAVHFLHHVHT